MPIIPAIRHVWSRHTPRTNGNDTQKSPKSAKSTTNPQDAATIEVAVPNGNETPCIETADANFHQLDIELRGFHDFGICMQEQRAGVKMNERAA